MYPWWAYNPWVYRLPTHPGYTTITLYMLSAVCTGVTLPDEDALGSTLGIVRSMRRREVSQLPEV